MDMVMSWVRKSQTDKELTYLRLYSFQMALMDVSVESHSSRIHGSNPTSAFVCPVQDHTLNQNAGLSMHFLLVHIFENSEGTAKV